MNVIDRNSDGQYLLFPVKSFGARKPAERAPAAHHDVDTSQAAAQSVATKVPSRKELAFAMIDGAGERELTNHELQAATGWLVQSTTPITNTLASEGRIIDSGRRRPSPAGVPCKVWVAAKGGTR